MSWSVGAIGRPKAVVANLVEQFSKNPCMEPEETVRQSAARAIGAALEAQDPSSVVQVMASGSMGFKDYQAKTGPYNNLTIDIKPLHGFVE